jgi:hypothetical protein
MDRVSIGSERSTERGEHLASGLAMPADGDLPFTLSVIAPPRATLVEKQEE